MGEKFHERFGIEIGIEEAKERFVNRALNSIFEDFLSLCVDFSDYRYRVQRDIITKLGKRFQYQQSLTEYIENDFHLSLRALEAFYEVIPMFLGHLKGTLESKILGILNESEVDLGVRWENGYFIKSGAELLDQSLVKDVLHWLKDKAYEDVLRLYEKGLRHFLEAEKRPEVLSDVVTDTYEALEALAKIVTGRPNNHLSDNRELFIKAVKASDEYKSILKEYIDYANRFRHSPSPTKPRPSLSVLEVESFIYLTGIFIRLAITAPDTKDVVQQFPEGHQTQ